MSSESSREDDMQQTVRSFAADRGTKPKKAWLVLELSFRERDSDPTADTPEIPIFAGTHLQDGKVRATLGERLRHSKVAPPEVI